MYSSSLSPSLSLTQLPSPRYPQHHYTPGDSDCEFDDEAPALGMGQLVPPLISRAGDQSSVFTSHHHHHYYHDHQPMKRFTVHTEDTRRWGKVTEHLPLASSHRDTSSPPPPRNAMMTSLSIGTRVKSPSRESTVVVSEASPRSCPTHTESVSSSASQSSFSDESDTSDDSTTAPTDGGTDTDAGSSSTMTAPPARAPVASTVRGGVVGGGGGGEARRDGAGSDENTEADPLRIQHALSLDALAKKREALELAISRGLPDRHAKAARAAQLRTDALAHLTKTVSSTSEGTTREGGNGPYPTPSTTASTFSHDVLRRRHKEEADRLRGESAALRGEAERMRNELLEIEAKEAADQKRFLRVVGSIASEVAAIETLTEGGMRDDASCRGEWAKAGLGNTMPTVMKEMARVTQQLRRNSDDIRKSSESNYYSQELSSASRGRGPSRTNKGFVAVIESGASKSGTRFFIPSEPIITGDKDLIESQTECVKRNSDLASNSARGSLAPQATPERLSPAANQYELHTEGPTFSHQRKQSRSETPTAIEIAALAAQCGRMSVEDINISSMPGSTSRRKFIDPFSVSPDKPSWFAAAESSGPITSDNCQVKNDAKNPHEDESVTSTYREFFKNTVKSTSSGNAGGSEATPRHARDTYASYKGVEHRSASGRRRFQQVDRFDGAVVRTMLYPSTRSK